MMTDSIAANKQLVQDFLETAFGVNKQASFQYLAEDVTWWVMGDPDKLKAAGSWDYPQTLHMLTRMHKVLPQGMVHHVRGITAEGNRVAVEVEARGPWYDGREYHNYYHFLFEITDNKISAIREYLDTLHVYELQHGKPPMSDADQPQ